MLPPFLRKLQKLVATVDPSVGGWAQDGNSFVVRDSDAFEKHLRKYYKGCLLTFVRQLHFYSFRKIDIKETQWSFFHKCFKRDAPHLIYEIKRKTRTETTDGVASQNEVQTLRTHVKKLESIIEGLTKRLLFMENELNLVKAHLHAGARMECSRSAAINTFQNKQARASEAISRLAMKNSGLPKAYDESISETVDSVSASSQLLQLQYEDRSSYKTMLPFADGAFEGAQQRR